MDKNWSWQAFDTSCMFYTLANVGIELNLYFKTLWTLDLLKYR